ncbi:MAG: hypothetical protein IT190_09775, partial [Microbacteriaceae bacterium]|nr:hypothetical protein [Microbacteriaceae bacterium]
MATPLCHNPFSRIPMGSITARLQWALCIFFITLHFTTAAQTDTAPVFKDAIAANRAKTYNNIVKNIITKNLSLPLTDSTEENWQDAFYAMEVLQYKQPWVLEKVKTAFDSAEKRSAGFQRALMECGYAIYPGSFIHQVQKLWSVTGNSKIFALCAEYLYQAKKVNTQKIQTRTREFNFTLEQDSILNPLVKSKWKIEEKFRLAGLKEITGKTFLPGNVLVLSFQRKNRNYPGIVLVRDTAGNFVTNDSAAVFAVTQLARSVSNLPFYLTNGNTPQGIFRMNGFAVSRSMAIGPTENIQLMMPLETSPQFFLKDSSITDTVWTKELYNRLLPATLKGYHPLLGTYYASKAGRTEIIAHGTTVDPNFYKGETYWPHTPTQGCLCTKEIWSGVDGKRTESNQQK